MLYVVTCRIVVINTNGTIQKKTEWRNTTALIKPLNKIITNMIQYASKGMAWGKHRISPSGQYNGKSHVGS